MYKLIAINLVKFYKNFSDFPGSEMLDPGVKVCYYV